jgi:hypothetical protein
MLECAASVLQANGWVISTGPLPIADAGFWGEGWEVVADVCRRFHYPSSFNAHKHELLILPSTFVGMDLSPDLNSPGFTKVADNVYCPSARLLAKTIATVYVRSPKTTDLAILMSAWGSYFYSYCGFRRDALDDAEPEVKAFWRWLGELCLFKIEDNEKPNVI